MLGDFNIHVCCPLKPMVKEFLHVIDTFNFVQSVVGPTHNQGHTLDLILSRGFSVNDVVIKDFFLSDHKSINFNIVVSNLVPQAILERPYIRSFNPSTSDNFMDAYLVSPLAHEIESNCPGANPDVLIHNALLKYS